MNQPPFWKIEQIGIDVEIAKDQFRVARIQEPLEEYLRVFDEYQGVVENLLEETVDLTTVRAQAKSILLDTKSKEAIRYLVGPPISQDDLKVLVETTSIAAKRLKADSELVERIMQIVLDGYDRRRFAWLSENREPSDSERLAAVIATTSLIATRRVETWRRNEGKKQQEELVSQALLAMGFEKVRARTISSIQQAPKPGEFCSEAKFSGRKADFIIGLFDDRVMPLECKVSNSSTNSVKRLNNDAAVKAVSWRKDLGDKQVVPAAVLSGVFKNHNVLDAQDRGLSIFWAHDLKQLTDWIQSTK